MRDFRDAKAMAQTLREALHVKSVSLTHSESLELVAKILAFETGTYWPQRFRQATQPPLNPGHRLLSCPLFQPERACPFFLCGISFCFRR